MAVVTDRKEQCQEVIEEYLAGAKLCIEATKSDGGILGYAAALLLLCATDAIGHASLSDNGQNTRLDILTVPPFSLGIGPAHIHNLTKWYRNLLAHTGTMQAGTNLSPETHGPAFDFDAKDALIVLRVPAFYSTVRTAWDAIDKTTLAPPPPRNGVPPPDPTARQNTLVSSLSQPASGVV